MRWHKPKEALLAEAGIVLEVLTTPQNEDGQGFNTTVVLQKDKTRQKFDALVTTTLNQARATQIAARQTAGDTPTLIITRYVPYNLGKKLREMNVQYIDAAGNTFINTPPLQFFINGNKRKERALEHAEKGFLTKGGVGVVFALLCKPELTKAPYRQIADTAGVAVGTVDMVMKRLQYHRFVENLGPKGRRLVQRRTTRPMGSWVHGATKTQTAYWIVSDSDGHPLERRGTTRSGSMVGRRDCSRQVDELLEAFYRHDLYSGKGEGIDFALQVNQRPERHS